MKSRVSAWIVPRPQAGETQDSKIKKILAERILRAEYDAAEAAFDQVRENLEPKPDMRDCGRRYIEATARLRKFLAHGEVPLDISERLDSGWH